MTVSRRNAKADCIVRADKALFDRVASGEQNAMAAFLRGDRGRGRRSLLLAFQRLFPGPAAERTTRRSARRSRLSDGLVQILDGNTFVVSDARGDIEASPTDPTGLFSFDTRFLSKWVLTVDGDV